MKPADGRQRVVIEDVTPQVDSGRHPLRRVHGEEVQVNPAIFADGKDQVAARVLYRHESEPGWRFAPMQSLGNDVWRGVFVVDRLGAWRYTLLGWIDHFRTWASDLEKRLAAQADAKLADEVLAAMPNANAGLNVGSDPVVQDIALAISTGAILVHKAGVQAQGTDAGRLLRIAENMERWAAKSGRSMRTRATRS
jgi:starch synthase (maltosyl-transferring)